MVARELLTETGSVFFQIGDENVHLVVRCLMDEVSGSDMLVSQIIYRRGGSRRANESRIHSTTFFGSRRRRSA